MKHVIAGDIGGTRARFAVFELGKSPRLVAQDVHDSKSFASFEAALGAFLDKQPKLDVAAASFGIAGPVVDQRVKTTNLPWTIDARKVAKKFRIKKVMLLNDLVAVGMGAIGAPASKISVVHGGRPRRTGGTLSVIAAGTGLGEATFVWDGSGHIACPTEGSHVDFAPRSADQAELYAELQKEHGHVSYERIASGSTIGLVYDFFAKKKGFHEPKQVQDHIARADDRNVAIVELAESGRSRAAMEAIDLWASVYGAEAGNLALKSLSTAGVLVCGGVSARLAKVLAEGLPAHARGKAKTKKKSGNASKHVSPFIEAFLDKGRMRPILEAIPVAVCLESRAGLLGAGIHAAGLAGASARI